MALPFPPDYREPIPNDPFYSPLTPYICGAYYPVEIGSGLCLNLSGHVAYLCNIGGGGGGSGTVTSVATGTGLTGGPITTSGTIALTNTTVTAGTYSRATITVDAQGRVTSASSNPPTAGGTVCSVTAGSGLIGGVITTNGTLSLNTSCVLVPSLVSSRGNLISGNGAGIPTALTIGNNGTYLTANYACPLALEWITPPFGCVSCVAAGTGLTGGPITTTGTISLANTAVTPGTYTNSTITVDSQGRLTAASNGIQNLGTVTCVASGPGLTGGPITSSGTLALNTACIISPNLLTAKGNIVTATAASTPAALPVGTNGQLLVACSTEPTGLKWVSSTAGSVCCIGTGVGILGGPITSSGLLYLADTTVIPGTYTYSCITVDQQGRLTAAFSGAPPVLACNFLAKGSLLVGTGAGTFTSFPLGSTNGRVLVVNSSCTSGVEWVATGALALCGYTCRVTPFNTAIGACAGGSITSGTDNSIFGYNSGNALTSGGQSVLVGAHSGTSSTTANGLTAIGYCAAACGATLNCGTYVGFNSGRYVTGGSNTYLGALTGSAAGNVSACGTLVGYGVGSALTTGNNNTLVGYQAGSALTTGSSNVVLGSGSLQTATTGSCNIAIGCGVLTALTTSCGNVAVGNLSLSSVTTGRSNIGIGLSSGSQISVGCSNILIGEAAGSFLTTGCNNTIIGAITGVAGLTDNLILGTGTTQRIQVNECGALSVGPTPSYGTAGQVLISCGNGLPPVWGNGSDIASTYGQFSSTITQPNLDTVNGNPASFDTTVFSEGVVISNSTEITFANPGIYNIQISLQVSKTDSGTDRFIFWFKKNGINIDNSTTSIVLNGNNDAQLASLNLLETFGIGDYVEIWWFSLDPNVQLLAEGPIGPAPYTPSVILTATPVAA